MNVLLKPIVRVWCALRHPLLRRRYRRLVLEEIDGVPLLVLPDVFNPVLSRTGAFLARALQGLPDLGPGSRVLDMGTGSVWAPSSPPAGVRGSSRWTLTRRRCGVHR